MEVEFYNAAGESIWTDTWPIQSAAASAKQTAQAFTERAKTTAAPKVTLHTSKQLQVTVADKIINFDATTGLLQSYQKQGQAALTHGPVLLRSDDSAFDSRKGVWPLHDGTRVDSKNAADKQPTALNVTTQNDDLVITVGFVS